MAAVKIERFGKDSINLKWLIFIKLRRLSQQDGDSILSPNKKM